uniref:CUB domain-containing protein n=1 Tax=Oreochromis aureus TaxID=47969 RepID=A0AAZ1Y1L4_OREAU
MRLVLISLIFSLGLGAQQLSLSGMYGSLRSPNFPEPYPRETQLRWNISVPDGFRIKLYFSHFDLEPSYLCEYDYVKVEAEGEVLALFCGKEQTDTEVVPAQQALTSPRNSLSLLFSSDFSDEERFSGFVAHYNAVDIDECSEQSDRDVLCDHFCHNYIGGYYCSCRYGYLLHSNNHTCRGTSGNMTISMTTIQTHDRNTQGKSMRAGPQCGIMLTEKQPKKSSECPSGSLEILREQIYKLSV